MDKNTALIEIEKLILFAKGSGRDIRINSWLLIVWHVILGLCFILSGVNYHFDNPVKVFYIWLVLVSVGWALSAAFMRSYYNSPKGVSSPQKKFIYLWLNFGFFQSAIGFSSTIEPLIFQLYPYFFGVIMASLLIIFQVIFELKRIFWLALLWFLVSQITLFVELKYKFMFIGALCLLSLIFYLKNNPKQND